MALLKAAPEALPLVRSWHHGLVQRVAGGNAAYAPACRLAKRWVAAHLLSNHVRDEAVELLVAAAFAAPGPLGPPGSRVAGGRGFAREQWGGRLRAAVAQRCRLCGRGQRG